MKGRALVVWIVAVLIALALFAQPACATRYLTSVSKLWSIEPGYKGMKGVGLAVDPRLSADSEIYSHTVIANTVIKYTEAGVEIKRFGPRVDGAGGTYFQFTVASYPRGIAVDPLTGFVYLTNQKPDGDWVEVVDAESAPVFLVREFNSGGTAGSTAQLCFSDDGMKLYLVGTYSGVRGCKEFVRDTKGNSDPTDDTFSPGTVLMNEIGGMGSPWLAMNGCAVATDGKVYLTDLGGTPTLPVRRYNTDGSLDLEFKTPLPRSVSQASVDSDNQVWVTQYQYGCRRYQDGVETFAFNPTDGAGNSIYFGFSVRCDRRNDRLITLYQGVAPNYYCFVQSYQLNYLEAGFLTGRVVDTSTGMPISPASVTIRSNTGQIYTAGVNELGVFTQELPPGTYGVKVSAEGYAPAELTGFLVEELKTTDIGDIAIFLVDPDSTRDMVQVFKLWEIPTSEQYRPTCVAVDPRSTADGEIYLPLPSQNQIVKYDKAGTEIKRISSPLGGFVPLDAAYPRGMAVDPLTGYLYLSNWHEDYDYVEVLDTSTDPETYITGFVAGDLGGTRRMAFSDDGLKLYIVGSQAGVQGIQEFVRDTQGTPDPTDDTFSPGAIFLSNVLSFDPWEAIIGCAVDREGKVYATDGGYNTTNLAVRKYLPSGGDPDLEFKVGYGRVSLSAATDNGSQAWIPSYYGGLGGIQRFKNGVETYGFLQFNDAGGQLGFPGQVAYDRKNERLVVYGWRTSAYAYAGYLQSYQLTALPSGTITGRILDAETGLPITSGVSVTVSWGNGSTTVGVDGLGVFTAEAAAGVWDVTVSAAGYFGTQATGYQVTLGNTTNAGDIGLLPTSADYVRIILGEHNIGQGVSISKGSSWMNDFPSVQGGRECRGFAPDGADWGGLALNVDDSFMGPGSSTPPPCSVWVEIESFDNAVSRWDAWLDCTRDWTLLGWELKSGSGAWKTVKYYRPDAYMGNRIYGDLFVSNHRDWDEAHGYPTAPSYFSKVTFRKTPTLTSFDAVDSIGEAKGQYYLRADRNEWYSRQAAGGAAVSLASKTVTAAFPDIGVFYVGEDDRSSGIRVDWAGVVPDQGNMVNVSGCYATVVSGDSPDDGTGEACIKAYSVDEVGTNSVPPAPVGIIGRAAGGRPVTMLWADTYPLTTQDGITGAADLSNVGLLCRVWGKVTAAVTEGSNTSVYLDDGSLAKGPESNVGLKLVVPGEMAPLPEVGKYATATGVMTLGPYTSYDPDGFNYPVVMLMQESDLVVMP